ncbi:hypothetical protein BJ165DRAFT_988436 [Panaeolus papilionaceus]|nr:hypothetical protein BJ165DRAFT_988436 [Panaeolus papilionaceus]
MADRLCLTLLMGHVRCSPEIRCSRNYANGCNPRIVFILSHWLSSDSGISRAPCCAQLSTPSSKDGATLIALVGESAQNQTASVALSVATNSSRIISSVLAAHPPPRKTKSFRNHPCNTPMCMSLPRYTSLTLFVVCVLEKVDGYGCCWSRP